MEPRTADRRTLTRAVPRPAARRGGRAAAQAAAAAACWLSALVGCAAWSWAQTESFEPTGPAVAAVASRGLPACESPCAVSWEVLAQGEYIGPVRQVDVPVYWLRAGDELEVVYRRAREEAPQPYELGVGDRIRVESVNDATLDRDLVVQPDGMVSLRMLGQVRAARRTVAELRDELEQRYAQYYQVPAITVTPVQVNTRLDDLWAAIEHGGGRTQRARVAPDGTIQLPAIGSVPAQGLSLDELKLEIDERYAQIADGIRVTPRLLQRAARYVYVLGEVCRPGRYPLEAPTTVMQAIALAGGWKDRGKLCQIVVFRRTEDWGLLATQLDLRSPLLGKCSCPADEIFLRDSDIVLIPRRHGACSQEWIDRLFAPRTFAGTILRP